VRGGRSAEAPPTPPREGGDVYLAE